MLAYVWKKIKKFLQDLLRSTDDVERLNALENQYVLLLSATRSLMETCTQLMKTQTSNTKSIDSILDYLTAASNPYGTEGFYEELESITNDTSVSQMTPEELEEYKKNLN
jgi:hypothetical protein